MQDEFDRDEFALDEDEDDDVSTPLIDDEVEDAGFDTAEEEDGEDM